jgi:hypothetical protein
LLPLLRLKLAQADAVALTPHRGVSTMGKQEDADPAGAGSALQSGSKLPHSRAPAAHLIGRLFSW